LRLGVYLTAVVVDGEIYTGLTNVGTCPTVLMREVHAETTILNFERDIYDKVIEVYFLEYLRPEACCDSIDALKAQIEKDKKRIEERGEVTWQEIGLS
jgi:riboflavin kinase/FMN adenylyltransferase